MASLEAIEGIGPANAKKLRGCGVRSCEGLLKKAGTKAGRKALAAESGVSESVVLEWANRADLMRIKGVSTQYSDLLEASGVDTVKELAQRNAENLAEKMLEVNNAAVKKGRSIVRRPPSVTEVTKWVAQAKKMKAAISH